MIFPWHFPWESMEISAMQHGCSKGPGWFHQPKKGRYVSAHGVPHLFRCLGLGGIDILNQKQKQCTSSAPRCFFLICQEVADVARLLLDKPRAYHLQKMIFKLGLKSSWCGWESGHFPISPASPGVTSISTVLRDPKDGPVVIAAENQGLLLNCLYGACSSSTEASLGSRSVDLLP